VPPFSLALASEKTLQSANSNRHAEYLIEVTQSPQADLHFQKRLPVLRGAHLYARCSSVPHLTARKEKSSLVLQGFARLLTSLF